MKWTAITLLLMNIAYFAWQSSNVDKPSSTVTPRSFEGKQLLLVSELDEQNSTKSKKTAANIKSAAVAKNKPRRPMPKACYSIGPFLVAGDVNNAADLLEMPGVLVQPRAASERIQVGYWVYISPRDTLNGARDILRNLKKKGVKDIILIAEGGKANAISAGVYRTEARAANRKGEIEAMGYKARQEALFRTQPRYWLDLELMKVETIPGPLWQKAVDRFPNIGQKKQPCE